MCVCCDTHMYVCVLLHLCKRKAHEEQENESVPKESILRPYSCHARYCLTFLQERERKECVYIREGAD